LSSIDLAVLWLPLDDSDIGTSTYACHSFVLGF
jgi:hypothetical protein